jgi:hypothetical protein
MAKKKLFVAYAAFDKEKGLIWGNNIMNGEIKTDKDVETARTEISKANGFETTIIINWKQIKESKP